MGKKAHGHKQPRSSEDGRFVKPSYAAKHPATTQVEIVPNAGYGDSGRGKKKK